MSDNPVLACQNLSRTFDEGGLNVSVLKHVTLRIAIQVYLAGVQR